MIRLKKIELYNYKTHRNAQFDFTGNFIEFKKPNEFGKSTIFEAIQDAFSFNTDRLLDKKSRDTEENPVVVLYFSISGKDYILSVNAQSNTVLLKGDRALLDTKKSMVEFFARQGFVFFPYVVSNLLLLRERDLDIDTKSKDFRKFTQDIFNLENINALKSTIDKMLKKDRGFQRASFGREFDETLGNYEKLREEIRELEAEFEEKIKKTEEFKSLSKQLEELEKDIEKINKNLENLKILQREIKRRETDAEIKKLKISFSEINNRLKKIMVGIKDATGKEKGLISQITEVKNSLKDAENAEKRLEELQGLIEDGKKKLNEIAKNRQKLESISKEIEGKEIGLFTSKKKIKECEDELEGLNEEKNKLQDALNIKDKENLLATIKKNYDDVLKKYNLCVQLEKELESIEEKLQHYQKYTPKELKDARVSWKTYESISHSQRGIIEVLKGSANCNGREVKEGERQEFEGNLTIETGTFKADIFTSSKLLKIKESLTSYFTSFGDLRTLDETIENMEKRDKIKEQLKSANPETLEKELNELKWKKEELEREIEIAGKKQEELSDIQEKIGSLSKLYDKEKKNSIEMETLLRERKKEKERILKWLSEVDENRINEDIARYQLEMEKNRAMLKNKGGLEEKLREYEKALYSVREKIRSLNREEGELIAKKKDMEAKLPELEKLCESLEGDENGLNNLPFGFVQQHLGKNSEEIGDEIKSLQDDLLYKNKERADLIGKVATLKAYVENAPSSDRLEEKRVALMELERKIENFRRMDNFLRTTRDVIINLGDKMEVQYVRAIEKRTSGFFERITHGMYKEAKLDKGGIFQDDFGKSWVVLSKDGLKFTFSELSDGAKTQLLLAIRLAMISLFLGDKKAFLMLDEPFAYYDREREKLTRGILKELSDDAWQIIIMSAKT